MTDAQSQWQRRERACEMRRAGMVFPEIAKELGISTQHAWRLAGHIKLEPKPSTAMRPCDARQREFMRVGSMFLSFFPARMSAVDAGRKLGISGQFVGQIEKLAAYKIAMAMRRELNYETHLS